MSRKQVQKIAQLHGASIEDASEKPKPAVERQEDDAANDLRKPANQERILNPDVTTVTLEGAGEVRMHKPSILMMRRILGFVAEVWSDASAIPTGSNAMPTRIASLLMTRPDLERRLFELAVRLTDKPGKINDARAESLADELQENATPSDVVLLFTHLSIAVGIGKTDPKN